MFSEGEASESEDSSDEEAELMNLKIQWEFEKIKSEREQAWKKKEAEEAKKAEQDAYAQAPSGNETGKSLKRKWYDDTVFKNQARVDRVVKRKFVFDKYFK